MRHLLTSSTCTLPCMMRSLRTLIRLNACPITILTMFLAMAGSSTCLADQLQWNASGVCEEAVQAIGSQSLLVSYCSQEDEDYVELWLVSEAYVIGTPAEGLFEVIVRARPSHESRMPFSSEEFPVSDDCWVFREASNPRWFYGGIDLAYVYIHTGGSTFQCLGRMLGLECSVGVETINLPDCVIEKIKGGRSAGRHLTFQWMHGLTSPRGRSAPSASPWSADPAPFSGPAER